EGSVKASGRMTESMTDVIDGAGRARACQGDAHGRAGFGANGVRAGLGDDKQLGSDVTPTPGGFGDALDSRDALGNAWDGQGAREALGDAKRGRLDKVGWATPGRRRVTGGMLVVPGWALVLRYG
ncbi:unnamed protein product, partial [Ilex paraguariensis]